MRSWCSPFRREKRASYTPGRVIYEARRPLSFSAARFAVLRRPPRVKCKSLIFPRVLSRWEKFGIEESRRKSHKRRQRLSRVTIRPTLGTRFTPGARSEDDGAGSRLFHVAGTAGGRGRSVEHEPHRPLPPRRARLGLSNASPI